MNSSITLNKTRNNAASVGINRRGAMNKDAAEAAAAATEMSAEDWAIIEKLPGNLNCMDCNAKYPEWGSVTFGILFCTRCSSGHRSLGTHISRVRSVRMDAWADHQIQVMKLGGNQNCKNFLEEHEILLSAPIRAKYDNDVGKLYHEVLEARVAGRREPKSLKEAARLKRYQKPKEWWNKLKQKGGDAMLMNDAKSRRNLMAGVGSDSFNIASFMEYLQNASSSADFWLLAYGITVVAVAIVWVVWSYGY